MAADLTIAETAPAKINLYLHVTGRRDDGYHLLDSLVVFADAGDTLRVKPADTLSLRIEGPFSDGLSANADNLVLRAAAALADLFGVRSGAEIVLEKNLPVSSGIGGGSADAAAAIRALADLWSLDLTAKASAVSDMALRLGADVPVCLKSETVRMRGVGERLSPVPSLPPVSILLVNPGVAVSTPDVFRARQGDVSEPADWPAETTDASALFSALATTNNDLQAAAIDVAPVIRDVLNALESDPNAAFVRMSGSGATCFALYQSRSDADTAATDLQARQPAWWIRAANLI
jgi:4-diphosphocytidyl-2-C-methyl-D-erythritol kinase